MTSINNLFNYSRGLPEPMNTLSSKKVKVSSKYGSGTESTLTCSVIKAVHAVCDCMSGSGLGAVGVIDHRYISEYKSFKGLDTYHIVVYDSVTGNIMASEFDINTDMVETYRLHQTQNDGAAVFMAMIPKLREDAEFEEHFTAYCDERKNGYSPGCNCPGCCPGCLDELACNYCRSYPWWRRLRTGFHRHAPAAETVDR